MTSSEDENSSQPDHSTKPTALASSVSKNVPGGASFTTFHAVMATSKSWPCSPTALPSIGKGRYLFPSWPSMIPSPEAASLPFGAREKNLSSAARSFSELTPGAAGSGGFGASSLLSNGGATLSSLLTVPEVSASAGGGGAAGGFCVVGSGSGACFGPLTDNHWVIMSRTLGASTTPFLSASCTPAMTSAWLPASMPALIRNSGDGVDAGGSCGCDCPIACNAPGPPIPGGCGGKEAGAPPGTPPKPWNCMALS
mmetsp:Transcript_40417/g.72618  ORF Transcript_40417/g.72618 Transcript_40417/m.72618 type:complete len:254 (-) Transcript_40417:32-793(-)